MRVVSIVLFCDSQKFYYDSLQLRCKCCIEIQLDLCYRTCLPELILWEEIFYFNLYISDFVIFHKFQIFLNILLIIAFLTILFLKYKLSPSSVHILNLLFFLLRQQFSLRAVLESSWGVLKLTDALITSTGSGWGPLVLSRDVHMCGIRVTMG